MSSPSNVLRIDRRFAGPPDSGNGGYVCGEMAKVLARGTDGPNSLLASGVRVRLMKPPPLETDLRIEATADGLGLFPGSAAEPESEDLLAQAWPHSLDLAVPEAVDLDTARMAEKKFRGFEEHIFPNCFVCGPDRDAGDGLRIFPGPTDRSAGIFAATWQPDASLRDTHGRVDPAFVWAALDCPGCFSFPQPENAFLLLGELSAAIHEPVCIDAPHILLSWQIEHKGRKHTTGTALYDEQGRCCARSRGIWIEIAN